MWFPDFQLTLLTLRFGGKNAMNKYIRQALSILVAIVAQAILRTITEAVAQADAQENEARKSILGLLQDGVAVAQIPVLLRMVLLNDLVLAEVAKTVEDTIEDGVKQVLDLVKK